MVIIKTNDEKEATLSCKDVTIDIKNNTITLNYFMGMNKILSLNNITTLHIIGGTIIKLQ